MEKATKVRFATEIARMCDANSRKEMLKSQKEGGERNRERQAEREQPHIGERETF